MSIRTISTVFFVLALTASCSTPQPQLLVDYRSIKQPPTLAQWSVQGKMAWRDGRQSKSIQLRWHQRQDNFKLSINGPFGIGLIRLDGKMGNVKLSSAKGEFTAATPELLLRQFTNLDLPISFMRYWLLGSPKPSVAVGGINYRDNRVIGSFNQVGWSVEYVNHDLISGNGQQYYLPTKIKISKGDLSSTILLKRWLI